MADHKRPAAQQGAWLRFEDEAGQTLRSPKGRTWGRKGHTPIVALPVKGTGRVSLAGLDRHPFRPAIEADLPAA